MLNTLPVEAAGPLPKDQPARGGPLHRDAGIGLTTARALGQEDIRLIMVLYNSGDFARSWSS